LVDVSASMGQHSSSLDAFTNTLNHTVTKIKQVNHSAFDENKIDCFAYGFGFYNPFALLSGAKTSAIKNLFGRSLKKPIVSLREVEKNWDGYKHDINNLALKAGGTSLMMAGLKQVEKVFNSVNSDAYGLKILVIVSDGLASDAPDYEILKKITQLKKQHTLIISLYLSDKSHIKAKIVHNQIDPSWDEGAKLMAECASSINAQTYLASYLRENDWTVHSDGKLLIQIPSYKQKNKQHRIQSQKKQTSHLKKNQDIVFISHHHHDKQCVQNIRKLLTPLKKDAVIKIWDDKRIKAEENWQSDIDELLLSAKAIVLLISPDYLATQFIKEETLSPLLKRAEHNGTKIIPLILEPSRFQFIKSLSCYPAINSAYQPLSALPKAGQEKIMNTMLLRIESALNSSH